MVIPFYQNSLETTFIKSLIASTPLPIYPVVRDGDFLHKDLIYIYKFRVIKCTKEGIVFTTIENLQIDYTYSSEQLLGDPLNRHASFIVIARYNFGTYYTNITENTIMPSSFYDETTHRAFGDYLHCLRNLYNIDLTAMYNCYSFTTFDDLYINPDITGDYVKDIEDGGCPYPIKLQESTKYKLLAFPIRLNTKYTIYIDTLSTTILMPLLKNLSGYILLEKTNLKTAKSYYGRTFHPIRLPSMSFKNPYVFEGVLTNESDQLFGSKLYNYEKSLYLVLQVDRKNESSVVVLEGDHVNLRDPDDNIIHYKSYNDDGTYTKLSETRKLAKYHYINADDATAKRIDSSVKRIRHFLNVTDFLEHLPQGERDKLFRIPDNSLLFVNDKHSYAFSDAIIPYLLLNVIMPTETIENNISRILEILPDERYFNDVWDEKIRLEVYNKFLSDRDKLMRDFIGFVDKLSESFLYKNKDKIIK